MFANSNQLSVPFNNLNLQGKQSICTSLREVPENNFIRINELTPYNIKFELHNTDLAIANALRRIMISEVPTLTIDLVEIKENTSALHDEFIAHRLGLVPLNSARIDEYMYTDQCTCTGLCTKCSVEFKMHVICPSERQQCDVTTKSLQRERPELPDVENPVLPVAYQDDEGNEEDPILLMKLSKNQQLDFRMQAKKGTGKMHAKWSPVSTCVMRKQPLVELNSEVVNRDLNQDQKKQFVAKCPRGVYKYNEFKQAIEIEDADKCSLCQECTRFATEELGLDSRNVMISENPRLFYFSVESTGALSPQDIVARSIKILQSKLNWLSESLTRFSSNDAPMAF